MDKAAALRLAKKDPVFRAALREELGKRAASKLASMATSAAKSKWGKAFDLLGPVFREMAVARELVAIMANQEPIDPKGQAARLIQAASDVMRG